MEWLAIWRLRHLPDRAEGEMAVITRLSNWRFHHQFAPLYLCLQGSSVARVFRVQHPRVLALGAHFIVEPAIADFLFLLEKVEVK